MANKKLENLDKALDILLDYKGDNPFIHIKKKNVYIEKKPNSLSDFDIEYIIRNYNFQPKAINKITKIPDWYGEDRKIAWKLEFTPEKIKIVSLLGETDRYYHCYVKYRQSVDPVMTFIPKNAIINNFLCEDYHNISVNFERYDNLSSAIDENRVLREHQKEAVQFMLSRKKCILADSMGLGKSTELAVAAIEGNFDSVLIICPASLKTNWKKELMWYVPEKDIAIVESFNDKKKGELETFLGYAEGKSGKKKEELLEEAKNLGKWQNNRFVIVNYDILDEFFQFSRATSEEGKQKALENSPILKYIFKRKSCLIVDEAHKLSNNTSKRYKVIKGLIKKGNPESVFLATGTPITNNPLNLYYVLNLIETDVTGDFDYYRNRYCDAKQFLLKGEYEKWQQIYFKNVGVFDWKSLSDKQKGEMKDFIWEHGKKITTATGAENLDELKERIAHIYLRRTKEDIGELPPKHVHEVYYDLSPQQQLEYDKLWNEYEKAQLEETPDKELNQELLEGGIYRRYISNQMVPKTIELCDNILKTENKVVIACCYDEELYTIKDHYGDAAVIYNGKCSLKQKDKAIDEFTHNPNVKVFVGNIIAAGVGITLTVSKSMIYNNISFVSGDNKQMEDRIYRIGQTKEVDIYYQIFKNTQYEHMWKIVLRKQMIADTVIKKETEK